MNPKNYRRRYGPWALVTGASSGIGMALATELAQRGFHLMLCGRSIKNMYSHFEHAGEGKIELDYFTEDLSITKNVELLIQACADKPIGLAVLAAGFGSAGYFDQSELQNELAMIDVNCKAAFQLAHHFAQRFKSINRGGIVFFSSIVAFQGTPFSANYGATKAYIQSLAEGLYDELKPQGIDVLAVAPGPVNTGFANRAGLRMKQSMDPKKIAKPILAALGRKRTIYPGSLSKILGYSLKTAPRSLKIRIMKMVMKDMATIPS
jgi:short-subunit dehydrogenase